MRTRSHLLRLMRRAQRDKEAEPAFFRALLDVEIYALRPHSDDSTYVRLHQLALSDGQLVVPFFTSLSQAARAAGTVARPLALNGKMFMQTTRGATLMLNPNGVGCKLYPEEVAALLDQGYMASVEQVQHAKPLHRLRLPQAYPLWLSIALQRTLPSLNYVDAAYLLKMSHVSESEPRHWLVVLAVPPDQAERAARAVATALQHDCKINQCTANLSVIEPGPLPTWLAKTGVKPFQPFDVAWPMGQTYR